LLQANVDIELLVFMEKYLRTRCASLTAQQLQLSKPTASRRLSMLRALFDDRLVVQTRSGAMLTPRAAELQKRLQSALEALRVLLASGFDGSSFAKQSFCIGVSPECEAIVPDIFASALALAAEVHLDFQPIVDAYAAMERGLIDLALMSTGDAPGDFHVRPLCPVDFGFFVCERHALAGRQGVSAKDLVGWRHVDLRTSRTKGWPVDDAFKPFGLERPTAGVFFSATSAIAAARQHHYILAAPVSAVRDRLDEARLRRLDIAFDVNPSAFALAWHDRLHRDPAQVWLRGVIAKSANALMAGYAFVPADAPPVVAEPG